MKGTSARVAASFAIGLGTFTVLLTGLGARAAGDPPGDDAAWDRLAVAPVRAGDRGLWVEGLVSTRDGTPVGPETPWASFEVLPNGPVRDERGRLHQANVLRYDDLRSAVDERGQPVARTSIRYHDPESGRLLAVRTEYARNFTHSGAVLPLESTERQQGWTLRMVNRTWAEGAHDPNSFLHVRGDPEAPMLCGVLHELQGRPGPAPGRLFRARCNLPGEEPTFADRENVTWTAVGWGELDSNRTLRLDRHLLDPRPYGLARPNATVFLDPRTAYPVRIDVQNAFRPELTHRLRLVDLAVGQDPVSRRTDPGPAAPPIGLLPRKPWGPDDTGYSHPFPPSKAWAQALSDPTDPRLRDFLGTHPNAAAVHASYRESYSSGSYFREWRFVVSDGKASTAACPSETAPWAAPQAGTPIFQRDRSCYVPTLVQDPACGPTHMPTAPDLQARWRQLRSPTGASEPANRWEFNILCGPDPRLDMVFGFSRAGTPPEVGGAQPSAPPWWQASLMSVDADRNVLVYSESAQTISQSPRSPLGAPPGPPEAEPATWKGTPPPGAGWSMPSAPVAAGAGLFALAVALAYAFWPALRAGMALPLFSRVTRPQALDQKARALVASIVSANPGIHFRALVRESGMARGTVEHHLRRLAALGLVRRRSGAGFVTYFDAHATVPDEPLALRRVASRRLIDWVTARPGSTLAAAADRLGVSRQAVHHMVRRLEAAGLLVTRPDASGTRLWPRPKAVPHAP